MMPIRAWIRECFSELSGIYSVRWRELLISMTRVVWASGLWLQEAMLASNTLERAGQSLSPADWHWGSNWSRMKASTLQSWKSQNTKYFARTHISQESVPFTTMPPFSSLLHDLHNYWKKIIIAISQFSSFKFHHAKHLYIFIKEKPAPYNYNDKRTRVLRTCANMAGFCWLYWL